jgi:hypothetical protein
MLQTEFSVKNSSYAGFFLSVFAVTAVQPRRREFAKLMPYHIFRYIYGNMLSSVMHGYRMTYHHGHYSRTAAPCLYHALNALSVLRVHFRQQMIVGERPFFKRSRH